MNLKTEFQESDATDAMNHQDVREWFYPNGITRAQMERNTRILQNNKSHFTSLYSKHHFCVQDSACRRLYCWKFNADGFNVWVITAPERGTSIEHDGNPTASQLIEQINLIFKL